MNKDSDSVSIIRLICALLLAIVFAIFIRNAFIKEETFNNKENQENNKEILKENSSEQKIQEKLTVCSNYFKTLQYEQSANCYKELLEYYKSSEIKYMAGISLGNSKDYKNAIEILQEVIADEKTNEDLRKKAQNAYSLFINHLNQVNSFEKNDIGDYIGDLSQIATWRKPKNIKIYIYDDNDKKTEIKQAFQKWDDELRSIIDFVYVDDEKQADITAKAVSITELPKGMAGETGMLYQYLMNDKNKLFMHKANIRVSYNNPYNVNWSDDEFRGIVLHEIGHALGILNHSTHRGDIMYYDVTTYRRGTISNRDVNTIKKIYGNI